MNTETVSDFDNKIIPLENIIKLIYNRESSTYINELYRKYSHECLINESSIKELDEIIKKFTKKTLSMFSSQYLDSLNFFSNDGLIYYIYSIYYELFKASLFDMI